MYTEIRNASVHYHSEHSFVRCQQRSISNHAINLIATYGLCINQRNSAILYIITEKIAKMFKTEKEIYLELIKLIGVAIVISHDNMIVTAFWCKNINKLFQKNKYYSKKFQI